MLTVIDCGLGGPTKELWIMLAITVPVALLTVAYGVQTGRDLTMPTIQIATIAVGSIVVWCFGGKIVEGITRIYGSTDKDRAVSAGPYTGFRHPPAAESEPAPSQVFCVHCGYAIPDYAIFCRRCGRRQ